MPRHCCNSNETDTYPTGCCIGYSIPRGGMFELVSGANFFGEILEWCGWSVAAWRLPAAAFALFTAGNIGPRAWHHHLDYRKRFGSAYPQHRKALIPFIL
jgi:3-oxo-5-alpha-steroid 4-dehydrogenase